MDAFSSIKLLESGIQFGLSGLVLVLWFLTDRSKAKLMQQYHEDMTKVLARYENDMKEIRHMYESNVKLVHAYDSVAKDLKDVVIINTQAMTKLTDDIRSNQFCPKVRLEKRAKGSQI
jgi:hypothetical protein